LGFASKVATELGRSQLPPVDQLSEIEFFKKHALLMTNPPASSNSDLGLLVD
jgi:hypothetical protein